MGNLPEGIYALADPDSAITSTTGLSGFSMCNEFNLFGGGTVIITKKTRTYDKIDDEPEEVEFDTGGWFANLGLGLFVAAAFVVGAVAVAATGGAALAVVALAGAAIGTGAVTIGAAYSDYKSGNVRSTWDFAGQLFMGAAIGAASGAAIYGLWAVVPGVTQFGMNVLGYYGLLSEGSMGAVTLASKIGAGLLIGWEGVQGVDQTFAIGSGEDLLLEYAFGGNVEAYDQFSMLMNYASFMFGEIGSENLPGKYNKAETDNDDVNRTEQIEVDFNYNSKYDKTEFERQLKDQEKGMNELTVQEYLDNRAKYIAQGRAIESNAAQQAVRQEALANKIEELLDSGMTYEQAESQATKWISSQAALHNPDQIAGGNPLNVSGMGDSKINSSIGSQWKYRIDSVDKQISKMAETMTEEERKNTYLNIKLTY